MEYIAAGLIGVAVGLVELIARYRESPFRAIRTTPAILYAATNLAAAVAALWLLRDVWPVMRAVGEVADLSTRVKEVLVAGLGAIAFFRTSLFTLRVGDSDMAVGPSLILDTLLAASDRAVDRALAGPRAAMVADIMEGISFEKAKEALPTHCLALMQNVSADEQLRLGLDISSLSDADMSDRTKALNLSLTLLNLVGEDVLRAAVDNLRDEISE